MTNNSINSTVLAIFSKPVDLFGYIISYFSLVIIVLALIGNTISFLTFRLNKELKTMSSMTILSFVCFTDTLSCFTWNLNHFLRPHYSFSIEKLNIHNCKFFSWLQYTSLQSSGLLLSLVCIDRYVTIMSTPGSIFSRLPFGTNKSAIGWSSSLVILVSLLNSFLLIFDRYEVKNRGFDVIRCYHLTNGFDVSVIWEKIHLIIYTLIPFVLMLVSNVLLIRKLSSLDIRHASRGLNYQSPIFRKMRDTTLTLLLITFFFIGTTLPAAVCYVYFSSFFKSTSFLNNMLTLIDYLSFLNHSSLFFSCFAANKKFRRIVLNKMWTFCSFK
jgi:hypothetical protein